MTENIHVYRPVSRAWSALTRMPAMLLVGLIRIYQRTVSPALPVLTMGRCGCRFSPTCSHYAVEAIRTHGAVAGLALAMVRLVKCTPLHPGGFDPVPGKEKDYRTTGPLDDRTSKPLCRAVAGPTRSRAVPSSRSPVVQSSSHPVVLSSRRT